MILIQCVCLSAIVAFPMYYSSQLLPWVAHNISDDVMHAHTGAGIASTILLLCYKQNPGLLHIKKSVTISLMCVATLAVLWEVFEWHLWSSQASFLGMYMARSPSDDYMSDIILALGAATIINIYYIVCTRRTQTTRVR